MGGLDRTRAPGTLALAALAFTPLPAGSASRAYLGIGKWMPSLNIPPGQTTEDRNSVGSSSCATNVYFLFLTVLDSAETIRMQNVILIVGTPSLHSDKVVVVSINNACGGGRYQPQR